MMSNRRFDAFVNRLADEHERLVDKLLDQNRELLDRLAARDLSEVVGSRLAYAESSAPPGDAATYLHDEFGFDSDQQV